MSEFKRLHPASILFTFLQGLRSILLPLIVTLFFSNRASEQLIPFHYIWLGFIFLFMVSSVLSYYFFRYQLVGDQLYVQKGVFIKRKRYIQRKRVQSIDLSEGVLQRLFGLVKLSVETAGSGSEPEIQLNAITKSEAILIRDSLKKDAEQLPTELHEAENENEQRAEFDKGRDQLKVDHKWVLSKHHLMIAALTSSGIGLTISAVGALFTQIQEFLPNWLFEETFGFLVGSGVLFILILATIVLFISWLISISSTILKYGNFTIEKRENEFIIQRGLLEKRQLTIREERITAVRIVSNIFRQPFGFTSVYVESAGGGTGGEEGSTLFLPLVRKSELPSILSELLPEYADEYRLQTIPKRAIFRYLRRATWVPITITAVGFYYVPQYALIGFIFIGIMLLLGYGQYVDAATSYDEKKIYMRFRRISQVIVISKHSKVQSVERQVNFFQKRKQLSSMKFSVQSSFSYVQFQVDDVSIHEADRILHWYSTKNQ
ncbi:PH domain-containing protein [Bacillus sp. FJAT-45037]|uniref:PH domain-containing protein n=1 Tax=Bacillus sp. FJAT-45037 TaxID=2011007 RepID=UPI0018E28EF4|nr:PH domain-containing protein [Bacillus sp. FJAT-45037]